MGNGRDSVLVLGINFAPEPIGIGKYTGEFVGHLVREGYRVWVVTAHPHYPWWRLVSADGRRGFRRERADRLTIDRCPLYVPSRPGGGGRILQDLSFFLTSWLAVTRLLLAGRRFDLVYTVVPSYPTAWLGAWVKLFRRRALWVVHVMDLQVDAAFSLGLVRSRWLHRLLAWTERRVLRLADRVSTISEGMSARLGEKGLPDDRRILFPNWVDLAVFHPGPADEASLAGLGLPRQGRMVLYSGAIGAKQCLDILPGAALRLADDAPDLFFVIAGEGPYRDRLASHCRALGIRNIHFIGIQPTPVFAALLRRAWLHLVLQRDTCSELFLPSKLGPILAVGGCAIVTADPASGLARMLREHALGVPLHPATAEALHAAVLQLRGDAERVRSLREAAARHAARHLGRDAVIGRYLHDLGMDAGTGPPAPGTPLSATPLCIPTAEPLLTGTVPPGAGRRPAVPTPGSPDGSPNRGQSVGFHGLPVELRNKEPLPSVISTAVNTVIP